MLLLQQKLLNLNLSLHTIVMILFIINGMISWSMDYHIQLSSYHIRTLDNVQEFSVAAQVVTSAKWATH